MTSLGNISVGLTGNFGQFAKGLAKLTSSAKELSKTLDSLVKSNGKLIKISNKQATSLSNNFKSTSKQAKNTSRTLSTSQRSVNTFFDATKNKWVNNNKFIEATGKTVKRTEKNIKKSNKNIIVSEEQKQKAIKESQAQRAKTRMPKVSKKMFATEKEMASKQIGSWNQATRVINTYQKEISESQQKSLAGASDTFQSYSKAQAVAQMQLGMLKRQGMEATTSIMKTAEGFKVGMGTMRMSADRSMTSIIKSFLNMREWVGKIMHYVTFSIGVQLVMQLRTAWQSMIETMKEFERAAVNASTVAGHLGGSFQKTVDHIMEVSQALGRTTVFSARESADAFYQLASAGYEVADITESEMTPILNYAAATQAELEDATLSVQTAMKAFGMSMSDTNEIVDTFTGTITNSFMTFEKLKGAMRYVGPIAGQVGAEIQETSAALAALTDRGYTGAQAGQRLNMIYTKLLKPTQEARDMLDEMGLTVQDVNPQIYTLTQILSKLKAAGFDAGDAAKMFRARTAAAAATLVDSVDSISRYEAELHNAAGITEEVADKQIDTLWGSMTLLQDAMQEASIQIGKLFAPTLRAAADTIRDLLPVITGAIKFISQFGRQIANLGKFFLWYKGIQYGVVTAIKFYTQWVLRKMAATGSEQAQQALSIKLLGEENAARLALANVLRNQQLLKAKAIALEKAGIAINTANLGSINAQIAAYTGFNGHLVTNTAVKASNKASTEMLSISNAHLAATSTTATAATGGLTGALHALKVAIMTNPLGLLVTGITAAAGALWFLTRSTEEFSSSIKGISEDVKLKEMADDFSALELAIWETNRSSKTLSESLTAIEKDMGIKMDISIPTNIGEEYSPLIGGLYTLGEAIVGAINPDMVAKRASKVKKHYTSIAETVAGVSEQFITYTIDMAIADKMLADEEINLQSTINRVTSAQEKYSEKRDTLNKIIQGGQQDVNELRKAEEDLAEAQKELDDANRALRGSVSAVMQEIRNFSEVTGEAIGVLEEKYKLDREISDLNDDFATSQDTVVDKTKAYTEALSEYGANSEQAKDAQVDLRAAISEQSDAQAELTKATEKQENAQDRLDAIMSASGLTMKKSYNQLKEMGYSYDDIKNYAEEAGTAFSDMTNEKDKEYEVTIKASQAERELIENAKNLKAAELDYNNALEERALLQAKQAAYDTIRIKSMEITQEHLKDYLEALDDVYDQELKLYKLRKDEKDQLSDLFDKLAEQGMINQDTIEGYKELKVAEGEVLSLNNKMMGVYGKLTDEGRELVESYKKGEMSSSEFTNALRNNADAIKEGERVTSGEINTVDQYVKAQNNLNNTVSNFKDTLEPVMDDLIDSGAVSSEVAAQWYDISDNVAEASETQIKLDEANRKLDESMISVIENAVTMSAALKDQNVATDTLKNGIGDLVSGERDLFDTYTEGENQGKRVIEVMLKQMDMWDSFGGSVESVKETLESFYGKSLNELTDAEVSSALAMVQMGEASGVWEEGMTQSALAAELGIDNIAAFQNQVKNLADETEDYAGLETGLIVTEQEVGDAKSEYQKILDEMESLPDELKETLGAEIRFDDNRDTWLESVTKFFTEDVPNALSGIGETIWSALLGAGDAIKNAAAGIWDTLVSAFGSFWDLFGGVGEGISDFAGDVWNGLKNTFGTIWELLGAGATGVANFVSDLWKDIKTGLGSLWSALGVAGNAAKNWATNLWNAIKYNVGNLFSALGASASEIQTFASDLWNGLKYKFGNLIKLFGGTGTFVSDLATDLIDGLTGIISIENLFEGLSGFADALASGWNEVADFFGFKQGAIVKAANGITETKGPQFAMIGEAGAEAVVPLEGANRDNGLAILSKIIPKYFPELSGIPVMQGGSTPSITKVTSDEGTEYHIHGDINVYSPEDAQDFVDKVLKELEDRGRMVR